MHCYRVKVNFTYPTISNKTIIADKRMKEAMDLSVEESLSDGKNIPRQDLEKNQISRAFALLKDMKAAISHTLIR